MFAREGLKKKEENNQTRISPVENPANNKTNDNIFTLTMKALQAIALSEEFLRLFAASAKSDYLQPGLNSLVTQPDLLVL